MIFWSR